MDKLQVFSEKLNSPIMIGTVSVGKDINKNNYYASWVDSGWSNGSDWINDGWSNGSNWVNDGWSNGSNWVNDGWSNSSSWINGGWSNGNYGGGGWSNSSWSDTGWSNGWYDGSWSDGSGGGGGGGKGSGFGGILKTLKIIPLVILILFGMATIGLARSGNLDLKFLRGSDYIGEWSYDSLHYTSDGIIYPAGDDFNLLCNYGINEDGTFYIEYDGDYASGSWTKAEIDNFTALILTYDEGTSSNIRSLIQDDVIYYIRTNNVAELSGRKGYMFFLLNGYEPEEAVYILFSK